MGKHIKCILVSNFISPQITITLGMAVKRLHLKHLFSKEKIEVFSLVLQRKYDDKALDYYVSNFVKSPKGWLGDFKEEHYLEWSKNKQSLTYNFITDMSFLFTIVDDILMNFLLPKRTTSCIIKELPRKEDFSGNDGNPTGVTELC